MTLDEFEMWFEKIIEGIEDRGYVAMLFSIALEDSIACQEDKDFLLLKYSEYLV